MTGALYGSPVGALGTEGIIATSLGRSIAPFEAEASGYDAVRLSWTAPVVSAGSGFRITRSRAGYPRSYDDGFHVVVVETPTWNVVTGYDVTDLPGGWHYFSFFVKRNGNWLRVSTVDALVPYDYGSAERLWDTMPGHYRYVFDDTASPSVANVRINPALFDGGESNPPNLLLWNFITVFGWGLDIMRSQAESVLTGYDVNTMHVSRLATVAKQFGHDLEQAVPSSSNRTVVRNLSTLYRKRGTIDGIRDLVTMSSGWDVDVSIGTNLMLSEEQAAFVNPEIPRWDETKQYATGALVKYGNYIYKALQTTRGALQAPASTNVTNTWWEWTEAPRYVRTANRADTDDVSTWQVEYVNKIKPGATAVAVGVPDPHAASDLTASALKLHTGSPTGSYTGGGTGSELYVYSVPRATPAQYDTVSLLPSQDLALKNAIALPNAVPWEPGVTYQRGEQVIYLHVRYWAKTETSAVPTDTVAWEQISDDARHRVIVSTYAHSSFTVDFKQKAVDPVIEEYDQHGNFLRRVVGTSDPYFWGFYDPFLKDNVPIIQGTAAAKGSWNSDGVGTWTITRDSDGGQVSIPASGKSHRWASVAGVAQQSEGNFAVTWTADPGTTRLVGIIFRRSDTDNYWIASQTGLYKVVAGVRQAASATWAKFTKGDRMRVYVELGSIEVYKNGTQVASLFDTFNETAIQHGLGTEA